jgi:hypothetical protein
MNNEQHQEDTKYLQWQDGMYVMLDDLECDYEAALVENSLRDSQYFSFMGNPMPLDRCLGVREEDADYWANDGSIPLRTKLTRAQALYIATGDTTCIGY